MTSQYSPYFINALTNHIFFVVFVEYILDNILIFLHVFWEKKSIEVYGCSDPTSRSIILHTLGLTTRKNRFRRPLSQVTQGKHPVQVFDSPDRHGNLLSLVTLAESKKVLVFTRHSYNIQHLQNSVLQ